ncbi:DMT family transporter [Pelagibacteraceae bacterium]|jgi:drug/metabolite transporter (DMT)-like permease|nr:DMT family transporter [Pelagibacteraceae bacterium]|tara:strand:- start:817 stop:1686 length:870 start_codon:yes stop_codon:yes gene_type:complete
MKYNNETLGALALIFAGVFLSFGGVIIRFMESSSAWQITGYRSITFSLAILLYILIKYKKDTPHAFKKIGHSGILIALILGFSNTCFVWGMSTTTVSNAVFIMSTGPLFAAICSYFFLKRKIGKKTFIAIAGSMFGITIMFSGGMESSNYIGNIIILGVPIGFAFQLTLLNYNSHIDFMPATFLGGVFSSLIGFIFMANLDISTHDLLLCLFMGAFQVGIGFMLITIGSRYIPPHRAALFLLMEPVLAPIWAFLGVGEIPGQTEMLGGLIVLSFVSYKIIDQFKNKEEA